MQNQTHAYKCPLSICHIVGPWKCPFLKNFTMPFFRLGEILGSAHFRYAICVISRCNTIVELPNLNFRVFTEKSVWNLRNFTIKASQTNLKQGTISPCNSNTICILALKHRHKLLYLTLILCLKIEDILFMIIIMNVIKDYYHNFGVLV